MFYLLVCLLLATSETDIIIKKGETLTQVAQKLEEKGIIRSAFRFKLWAKITGNTKNIKAGGYVFSKPTAIREILVSLVEGKTSEIPVTIPEGATLKEIAWLFWKHGGVDKKKFLSLASDTQYIKTLNIGTGKMPVLLINARTLEGFLFPATYFITYAAEPQEIIERMVKKLFCIFTNKLEKECEERESIALDWSPEKIVIFASLIEKEAVVDSEKPIISSVYHNRLRINMALQCDATIQYILPKHKNRLTYEDLKIKSLYNTYLCPGLPPGPICSPGESSLKAALFPESTKYLYFVAKGDGTHIFSKTHKEHIKAKKMVRLMRNKK